MASTAKIIIKAENNIEDGVNGAKKSLSSFGDTAEKVGSKIKSAFTFTAIIVAIKKVATSLGGCMVAFEEAERKYNALSLTFGRGETFDRLKDKIVELSRKTLEGKGAVESIVSELAELGKSEEDIEKIAEASVYLSNVTGRDLNSSMTTLLQTYNGTTTALRRMGLDLGEVTKAELKEGKAIEIVTENYKKYSDALALSDTRQNLQNIKNTWGDIKQDIGDIVSFSFTPLIKSFDEALSGFEKKLGEVVENIKIVFSSLPLIMEKLGETLSSMMSKVFRFENLVVLFKNLFSYIEKLVSSLLRNIANGIDFFVKVIPETIKALFSTLYNYVMYIILSLSDEAGGAITETVNRIGAWLKESKIGEVVDKVLTTVINALKLIFALIQNIPEAVRVVTSNIVSIVKNLFITIKNFFLSLGLKVLQSLASLWEKIELEQKIENIKTKVENVFLRISTFFQF